MQGDEPCNRLENEMRRVLDELRRCRRGGAPGGGGSLALMQCLKVAADAVPAQRRAFPPGTLEELADVAARHEPGSDAAAAYVSVLIAVGFSNAAPKLRQQVLRSRPALRCGHGAHYGSSRTLGHSYWQFWG